MNWKSVLRSVVDTGRTPAATVLRVVLGVMIAPHGAQKLFGWFGGPGLSGWIEYAGSAVGLSATIAFLVALIEFFGGLALLGGVFGRLAAAAVGFVMAGAVLTSHAQFGFFMNWSGSKGGEGWEFHLLAIGIAVAVWFLGSGAASLDRVFAERLKRTPA